MTKEILIQLSSMQEEVKELRDRIEKTEAQIQKLSDAIKKIESEGNVVDTVTGGSGGIEHFKIEGFPYPELDRKKTLLLSKRVLLKKCKEILEDREIELAKTTNDAEEFITTIKDSRTRRIIEMRCVDCMSWYDIADRIGGGNTSDCVRMAFNRYFEQSCSTCSV